EALLWWRRITRHAVVRDDLRLRGTGLISFGSFSFADDAAAGGTMIVPRYVLGRVDGRSFFTVIGDDPEDETTLAHAVADASPAPPLPSVTLQPGDESGWSAAVSAAVGRIESGEVDKVVLARAVEARADGPIDVRPVLRRLAEDYDMCWTFHV